MWNLVTLPPGNQSFQFYAGYCYSGSGVPLRRIWPAPIAGRCIHGQ